MSGDHINVNMYGGTNNTGVVKNVLPTSLDPEQRAAVATLTE
ncbi:hypothetical protein ACH4D3_15000 [Streptomyces sp. NPDC018026]